MGTTDTQPLSGSRIYSCSHCRCHNAYHDDIMSKAFQGRHGRAYLFSSVSNVTLGVKEDRLLITGLHTVCDIYCVSCSALLGWKYETAYEQSQKYKEGKFIVEKAMVMREGGWQDGRKEVKDLGRPVEVKVVKKYASVLS